MSSHTLEHHTAYFRFYEELNDFLPNEKRKQEFAYKFRGEPSIKDTIQAIGVPHTEIDLILVNGVSVNFEYQLFGDERISVYPVFEALDISPLIKLRSKPLRESKFIADVHLGTLARKLRLLGFDTLYQNNFDDPKIIDLALAENRIILTRDKGILKQSRVTHGYWIRNSDPIQQTQEVVKRFQLGKQFHPFSRCTHCNSLLVPVNAEQVSDRIPQGTQQFVHKFHECTGCGKIYWRGTHFSKITAFIQWLKQSESS